ncbi:MAG: hypothetical protein HKM04_09470 [Legionellales bacterium]|nr:hypothetical protein [Legionellales bacterium]
MKAVKFDDVQRMLEDWIDNLPLANPLKVSELIYSKLAELPITEIKPIESVQLLEMLRPAVDLVSVLLQAHLGNKGAQSIIETDNQITFAMSLLTRYASAYAVLLNSINSDERFVNGKPLLAVCIHRALSCLSHVLLIAYQLYRTPPTQIWLRVHKLYLQAERIGLASFSLPHASDEAQTISEIYKICILLASANPYQLRPLEMYRLYQALLQWSHYTKIKSSSFENTLIIIKLDEDAPPFYQKPGQPLNSSPFLRGLDTTDLVAHIIISIKQHGATLNAHESVLPPHVLQNIANSWSRFTARLNERNVDNSAVQVSIGITSTHTHVSAENGLFYLDTQSPDEQAKTFQVIQNPIQPNQTPTSTVFDDPWDTSFSHTNEFKQLVDSYPLFNWQIVNSSAHGFCLEVNIQQMIAIEAGELIGLYQKENKSAPWRIATIRWIKKIDDYRFQLGLLILASSAVTATVQLSNSPSKHHYRAFILSNDQNISKLKADKFILDTPDIDEYSIVFPALDLIPGEHLIVLYGEHRTRIKLMEPLCLNSKFYQFKYQIINENLAFESNDSSESIK